MTHDLLQLAEDLSDASTRQSNGFYTPDLPSLGFSAAAALRAAHEEIERLRKAIEDAPIGDQCDGMQCIRIFEEWQSKALGEKNGKI